MSAIPRKFSRTGAPLLHVDDSGGNGLPVIFQHGLCGDRHQTFEAFPADPLFRRITVESRGHGASEPGDPRFFSVRTFAGDIADFIEAHLLAPIVVGGISMGAAIALHLAVRRPALVRGLILARPAWVTTSAPINNRPNAEVGLLLATLPSHVAKIKFEASETAKLLAEIAPDNLASLRGFFSREPQAITAALLQAIAADGPGVSENEVRNLEIPSLVIGHDIDYIHPFSYAAALSDLIPGSQLVRITPKATSRSHYLEEFRTAISNFLRNL